MPWAGSGEHSALYVAARDLIGELRGIQGRLVHGDVQQLFHTQLAARCRSLALYLESAVADVERDAYAPALGSLRSALEHVFVDKLAFLADRYVAIFTEVSDATWEEWQRQRDAGEAWNEVVDWKRSPKGVVRATMKGVHSSAESGDEVRETIGLHYFLFSEYSPFVGPPGDQEYFDDGLSELAERQERATFHRSIHAEYLKWLSVKASLVLNSFADAEMLRRLAVHYRFLSAFTHPNTDVAPLLYGRNVWDWPQYDHYSSELVLLYTVVLAVEELRNFRAMTQRHPTVDIDRWDTTEGLCDRAWQLSSYFWFPGQDGPHGYDRFAEANRRGFRAFQAGDRAPIDPAALTAEEIGYYADPLQRLIALHSSRREFVTGLGYESPWHRADAHLR